jgi:hypothetical protein
MLTLDWEWPGEPFSPISPDLYLIPHLGQRKLLIAEIAFLAEFNGLSDTVIYAGAGPGVHIAKLAELFPHKMFYLYDPRPFAEDLKKYKNISMHQEYFTLEVAKHYADLKKYKRSLFISDIRTGSDENFEEGVRHNLEQQKQWCDILKPCRASLKFRLPFGCKGDIEYFDGEIRLQPWCGRGSSETRLWTDCQTMRPYNCDAFDEKMSYFNKHLRAGNYNCGQCEPMDFCNDCFIEWRAWEKYSEMVKKIDICHEVNDFWQTIKLGPHGKLRDKPVKERLRLLHDEAQEFYIKYEQNEHKRDKENKTTKRINQI